MSQAFMSPDDFVYWATVEGFYTDGGKIKLRRYISSSEKMGGSYTAQDLMNKLKTLMGKVGGAPTFKNYVRIFTGQGDVGDFMAVWNWMYAHLPEVRKLKVQTFSLSKNADDSFTKNAGKVLDLSVVFKEGRPFPEAVEELVKEGCFGWDCIGFVSQYLVTIGQIDSYPSWECQQYLTNGKFAPIKSLYDLKPCSVLVFGTWHIVLVNGVDSVTFDERKNILSAKVSISQSYTGGPHTRKDCILMQSKAGNGWGPVNQTGVLDVAAKCIPGLNPEITIRFPPYGNPNLPDPAAKAGLRATFLSGIDKLPIRFALQHFAG